METAWLIASTLSREALRLSRAWPPMRRGWRVPGQTPNPKLPNAQCMPLLESSSYTSLASLVLPCGFRPCWSRVSLGFKPGRALCSLVASAAACLPLQDQYSAAGTPAPKSAPYDEYSYAGTPPVAAAPSEVRVHPSARLPVILLGSPICLPIA